jgi:superfamily I DNA/RNA helicase
MNDVQLYNEKRETRGGVEWSPQQRTFLDWCEKGTGSCVLVAVAGAGKTTVLIEGGRRIRGGVAYMAYNKDIVRETEAKLQKLGIDWKKMQAKTAHGFGLAAYRKARGWSLADQDRAINDKKVYEILDRLLPDGHDLKVFVPGIAKLVSLAKQSMFGVLVPIESYDAWAEMADHYDVFDDDEAPVPLEEVVKMAIEALKASIAMLDTIDYDDMIYMPLKHRVRFWQHDVVMVDEAQDTNAARRALVRAMLRKGGRVVAVGDPHQAIYGFTGADSDALDLIARDFDCARLNLTVSFRCPQFVVNFARQWVGHIEASPHAAFGQVSTSTMVDFFKRNDLAAGSAVLCRVTKPLVSLAFALIRRRIACRIEGRDVANSIKKLMTRWKVRSLDALEGKLEGYLARETTKLLAKKQEAKLQQVEDAVETIRVIVEQCRAEKKTTVDDAVAYVDSLFGDKVSDVLVLSSIHKAKGREWGTVFWLDRVNTCPSKWARQAWQQEQERNLCYVAATRSKDVLVELDAAVPGKKG